MELDLAKASRKISELDLKIIADNLAIDVLWFKAIIKEGEWIVDRHKHSTFEFHFIAWGACKVKLDDTEFEIKAGESFLTAPGVYHEQISLNDGNLVEYCMNCDIRLVEDKSSEAQSILKILQETSCKPVRDSREGIELFSKILREAYYQNVGFLNNIKSLIIMLIIETAREIGGNLPVKYEIAIKKRKLDQRLAQIEEFIEENISNHITTGEIARYIHLSDKQVCRIIAARKGVSTKEFIKQIKLQKARELLKETNLSIKQIADKLGFSSEYYFGQFFKREEGSPPGFYRKNI